MFQPFGYQQPFPYRELRGCSESDPSKNTITWQDWAGSPAVGKSAQYRRKHVLELWAKANGKDSPQGVLDDIFLDKVTPYGTVNKLLNQLREQGIEPGTISLYRSMFGGEETPVVGLGSSYQFWVRKTSA